MKRSILSLGLLAALAAPACMETSEHPELNEHSPAAKSAPQDDDDDAGEESEEPIALEALPANVREAALKAVPGLVIESAEKETEGSDVHYCISGKADGEAVEVEVSPDGKIGEIEHGDDDDGGDDDDDDGN